MRTPAKISLVVAVILAMLVLIVSLVAADTKVARWLYDDGGHTSNTLLKRAAPAWSLDAASYRYAGVRSTKGWVIVHRWESRNGRHVEVIDVTVVEGLVCYSRRDNDTGQLRIVGCNRYPG